MTPISTTIRPISNAPATIARGFLLREPRQAATAAEAMGNPDDHKECSAAKAGLLKGNRPWMVVPRSIELTTRPTEPAIAATATTTSEVANQRLRRKAVGDTRSGAHASSVSNGQRECQGRRSPTWR